MAVNLQEENNQMRKRITELLIENHDLRRDNQELAMRLDNICRVLPDLMGQMQHILDLNAPLLKKHKSKENSNG